MANSCIVLSVPRSGTHLVMCLLRLLGMKEFLAETDKYGVKNIFNLPKKNHFCFGTHIPFDYSYLEIMKKKGIKGINISRDIRDVVTSFAFYIRDFSYEDGHKKIKNKSPQEQISYIIKGDKSIDFPPIANRIKSNREWNQHEIIYHATFEKLIGENGGGSEKEQFEEIKNICRHLDIKIKNSQIGGMTKELWRNPDYGENIRKGIIGNHKDFFTDKIRKELKEAMKNV